MHRLPEHHQLGTAVLQDIILNESVAYRKGEKKGVQANPLLTLLCYIGAGSKYMFFV